jgi:hypothetical protein
MWASPSAPGQQYVCLLTDVPETKDEFAHKKSSYIGRKEVSTELSSSIKRTHGTDVLLQRITVPQVRLGLLILK